LGESSQCGAGRADMDVTVNLAAAGARLTMILAKLEHRSVHVLWEVLEVRFNALSTWKYRPKVWQIYGSIQNISFLNFKLN
jgi:hypothetical protein